VVLVGGWASAVFVFQPYGHRGWAFATIAAFLAWLLMGFRVRSDRSAHASSGLVGRLFGRPPRPGKIVLGGALSCWLGLIAWSSLSSGGAMPPPKSNSDTIRVVTWNILHGTEHGAPWTRFDWTVRKEALRSTLEGARPDILCVQEALFEQV